MLKKTIVSCFFFISLFMGCDPVEKDEIDIEIDTTDPVLSISGIEPTIEKATTLNVSITDSSNISATLSINGVEVFNSTAKTFSFEFDPFEYPSGANTATLIVTDDENNTTEQTFQFQVNKLLYRLTSGFSSDSGDAYVAINLFESGELIANRKINSIEDADFYANDDFVKQDLIITHYFMSKNSGFHIARSYGPIPPGKERLTFDEVLNSLNLEHRIANQDDQFTVSIQNTPGFALYQLLGHDYAFGNVTNPNMEINYDADFTSDIFLYHHSNTNDNLLNDYKYLYTQDFTDKDLDFTELISLTEEQIITIDLPSDVTKTSLALLGYNSQADFANGYFRLLYNSASNTADIGFSLNYPELDLYEVVEKTLNLDLADGRKVRLERNTLVNVQIPDWSIVQNGNIIDINGAYDFSTLSLTTTNTQGDGSAIFRRIFQNTFDESVEIPFEKIEIPDEIIDFLTPRGFDISTTDASGELLLTLRAYENNIVYPDGKFYDVFRNETGDATQVIFPLSNE